MALRVVLGQGRCRASAEHVLVNSVMIAKIRGGVLAMAHPLLIN